MDGPRQEYRLIVLNGDLVVPRYDFILPPLSLPACLSGALRCQTDRRRVSMVAARRVSHGMVTQPSERIRTMGVSV